MPLSVAVRVPAEDRAELVRWTRTPSLRAGLAQRARIVLLAGEGVGTNEIVTRVGVSKPTVIAWKRRYAAGGRCCRRDPVCGAHRVCVAGVAGGLPALADGVLVFRALARRGHRAGGA